MSDVRFTIRYQKKLGYRHRHHPLTNLLQIARHCFDLEKDVLHVSIIRKTMEIAITVQKISDK